MRLFCVFVFLCFALLAALFCVAVVVIGVTAALRVGFGHTNSSKVTFSEKREGELAH